MMKLQDVIHSMANVVYKQSLMEKSGVLGIEVHVYGKMYENIRRFANRELIT